AGGLWLRCDGGADDVPRGSGQGRRDQRAPDQAVGAANMRIGGTLTAHLAGAVALAGALALIGAARAQDRPKDEAKTLAGVEAAIKGSWTKSAPDWQARLVQDETQRLCSLYRNAPPNDVANAIVAREKAAIKYPADGKPMGDWKKGEKLAQSGYGGRFTDY